MTLDELRNYCLSFPVTSEHLPFDDKTLVFKVANKMFALVDLDSFESVNVKCDPEKAIVLRETYSDVQPGYHMSKKHWNTVKLNNEMNDQQILEWINDSYQLVYKSLPAKLRSEIENR